MANLRKLNEPKPIESFVLHHENTVEMFDHRFLKNTCIKEQFIAAIMLISKNDRTAFSSKLGKDLSRTMCQKNEVDLPRVLDCLSESNRMTFLSSLDNGYLSAVCKGEADLARIIDRIPEKHLKNWLFAQRTQLIKIYTRHNQLIDYKNVARRIHEVLLPIGKRKQLLLSLTHIYQEQRSRDVAYTSIWGSLFGYHKNAKLAGAASLIKAMEDGQKIEKNGVLDSGDLGMIANAYCALSR